MIKLEQLLWNTVGYWSPLPTLSSFNTDEANLVMYFGDVKVLDNDEVFSQLKKRYPNAHIVGCSGAGEILNSEILDEAAVAVALTFENTTIKVSSTSYSTESNVFELGQELANKLAAPNLQTAMAFCDGINIDGHGLVDGLKSVLGDAIPIFGGLASDGFKVGHTLVGVDEPPSPNKLSCVGFYGQDLLLHWAVFDGCCPFGPVRKITKAKDNVVYELDGEPALRLFKRYLGEESKNLPTSAMQFPLRIRPSEGNNREYNRSVVDVNEKDESLIFAGSVPEGCLAQLMRASFDRLVESSEMAAILASKQAMAGQLYLALLVSCAGRKIAYGDRIGAEVEVVGEALGSNVPRIGFYSHGEIAPHPKSGQSELHNHTMTIFMLSEKSSGPKKGK